MNSQAKGHFPEKQQSEKALSISELCTQLVWMMLVKEIYCTERATGGLFDIG